MSHHRGQRAEHSPPGPGDEHPMWLMIGFPASRISLHTHFIQARQATARKDSGPRTPLVTAPGPGAGGARSAR